jgi:hypothetical protein
VVWIEWKHHGLIASRTCARLAASNDSVQDPYLVAVFRIDFARYNLCSISAFLLIVVETLDRSTGLIRQKFMKEVMQKLCA